MKNFNTNHDGESPAFCKYRRMPVFFTLFLLFFTNGLKAQGPCSGIDFSFEQYEDCKFRARYNSTSECFIEIRYILESGTFSSFVVNTAAGFSVQEISSSELWVHHNQGFVPLGNQVPLLFTLPHDLNTTMNIAYLDDCAMVGCEIFGGIPIESCPDPKDASIIGVKYRECSSLPYSNQPVLSGWTIQLLDVDDNVLNEQLTDAGGGYGFYDLPAGIYVVKETQQPGWMPKVPANGRYSVDLTPSQQVVRNFGNCQLTKPVSGVIYQTCDSMPYLNQPVLSGWVVQFLDDQGNIVAEDTSDSNGFYNEDLPPGHYWVKLAVQPGWTPNFPLSGKVFIDLMQQSQAVQNFGVCYNCCSTVTSWITQNQNTPGKCCYSFTYISATPSCVTNFYFLANGIDPSSIVTLPGWTVGWINSTGFQILPPANGGGVIPAGNFTPVTFCINNNGLHDILTDPCYTPQPTAVCCC
ncbi:MAG: hypothetical protein H7246_17230 [Phycisphaerae bacterium]|nr:hypothetical protein [Saprospiraceae bacterium]